MRTCTRLSAASPRSVPAAGPGEPGDSACAPRLTCSTCNLVSGLAPTRQHTLCETLSAKRTRGSMIAGLAVYKRTTSQHAANFFSSGGHNQIITHQPQVLARGRLARQQKELGWVAVAGRLQAGLLDLGQYIGMLARSAAPPCSTQAGCGASCRRQAGMRAAARRQTGHPLAPGRKFLPCTI